LIYNWKLSWDWDRIKKIRRQKGIGQARPENPDKFYAAIERAVKTRHKTLIHEMIDNYKKDGYTFGVEHRKSKTGRIYNGYLYRQKRNVNGKTKEHICLKAKDLDDYRDNVLLRQARMEVYRDKVGGWAAEGLTPSEMETFRTLSGECLKYRRQLNREPVRQKYIKQLGLKVKNRKYCIIAINNRLTIQKTKNILKAAKKALAKQEKAHKKFMEIIEIALNEDHSPRAFISFIRNILRESKCRNRVKDLQNYIKRCIEQDSGNNSSLYSILKPSEIKCIAEEIIWINKKSTNSTF
jgi:hypothetical protein